MVYYTTATNSRRAAVAIPIDISKRGSVAIGYIIGPIIVFSLHNLAGFIYFHYIFVYFIY